MRIRALPMLLDCRAFLYRLVKIYADETTG